MRIAFAAVLAAAAVLTGAGSAAFPGKQGEIAFDTNGHLWVVGADGTGLRQLTKGSHQDSLPSFSPDGKCIAFTRDDLIYTMNADGTNAKPLYEPAGDERDNSPAWSPNGKQIAFVRSGQGLQGAGQGSIWVISSSGGGTLQLASKGAPGSQFDPAWSPDGKWIAFTDDNYPTPARIYKEQLDGTGLTQLTSSDDADSAPDWSPDGTQIVFSRWHDGNPPVYKPPALWLIGADGTGLTQLTKTSNRDLSPAFSPDGKRIAFSSSRKPHGSVFAITLATGHVARLAKDVGFADRVSWQPVR